ncbi:MAG: DegQ family serine endoprotease [Pseudomonadota bacterium]
MFHQIWPNSQTILSNKRPVLRTMAARLVAAAASFILVFACSAQTQGTADTPDGVVERDNTPKAIRLDDRMVPETMEQVRLSFAPVVSEVAPAVVNVFTRREVPARSIDPVFERFFGQMRPREQSSLGSGVIVSPDGYIITNNHVIEKMTEITVVLSDRREFEATLVFTDPQTDLAVLQITADETLPFLEFANSDVIEVGDVVLAIGNPFGVGQTVTSGIISALARTAVSISDYQFFIQTDAAINPGNSGGALVDVDGRLVGINTAIYSRSGGSNGIGFAIPSRLVQQVLSSAVNGGVLARPWLGASTGTVTADLSRALKLDRPAGAIIEEIWVGGPADKAGLKPGDVIIEIDGQPVYDAQTLRYRVGVGSSKDKTALSFARDGKSKTATLTLDVPPETPKRDVRQLEGNHPLTGVSVANLSPKFNEELGVDPFLRGVVVTDIPRRSYAARQGLRKGYRILAVNGENIDSARALTKALATAGRRWVIDVDNGRRVVSWRTGR